MTIELLGQFYANPCSMNRSLQESLQGSTDEASASAHLQTWMGGIPIDALSTKALILRIAELVAAGGVHLVCYLNADGANRAAFDRAYRRILQRASLVYADGMGVVWASRLTRQHLPQRITLGDLLPDVCHMAARRGLRLFLLGGPPGLAAQTAKRLQEQCPELKIAGTHHGYFLPAQDREVIELINQQHPDILLVGMGVPKQEKWLWRHRQDLDVPVLWGVGAAFEYHAGVTRRAPIWMCRCGLEWCFRLLLEPRRLWRRYLVGNALFFFRTCGLLITDGILVMLAWLGAYAIRDHFPVWGVAINSIRSYVMTIPLVIGLWLVACATLGLYRRSRALSVRDEFVQVAGAACLAWLVTIAAGFLLRELSLGRSVVLLTGGLLFGLLMGSRLVVRAWERYVGQRRERLRRTLIVGIGTLARQAKGDIESWPTGYDVIGFVGDHHGERVEPGDLAVLGGLKELRDLVEDLRIDDVFIASDRLSLPQAFNLLDEVDGRPVNVHIASEDLEMLSDRVALRSVSDVAMLDLPALTRHRWYEWSKRVCDSCVASLGLLLALPWCGIIALLIKAESRGPVLFMQERIGQGGRRFRMYKFRTMNSSTPPYDMAPNDLHDPRVTRLGRWLRRWSLDELPQLMNVLTGDMSLVGPRPEMPFLVNRYEPWQRQRLSVTPGLTCLWQVMGRKELPLHSHLEYDLYYVRHRGWWLDATILLRTIPAVLHRRGAF